MTFDDPFRRHRPPLAPLAKSGHIRDFELRSVQQPDGYHRRGFDVRYRYPGEGVAPIQALIRALADTVVDRPYDLLVEGLDSQADVDDQHERLAAAMAPPSIGAPGRRSVKAVVFTGAGDNDVVQVLERDDPEIAGDAGARPGDGGGSATLPISSSGKGAIRRQLGSCKTSRGSRSPAWWSRSANARRCGLLATVSSGWWRAAVSLHGSRYRSAV